MKCTARGQQGFPQLGLPWMLRGLSICFRLFPNTQKELGFAAQNSLPYVTFCFPNIPTYTKSGKNNCLGFGKYHVDNPHLIAGSLEDVESGILLIYCSISSFFFPWLISSLIFKVKINRNRKSKISL